MQSIALIDYGSGNLRSAEKALLKVSAGMDGARRIDALGRGDADARAAGGLQELAQRFAGETHPGKPASCFAFCVNVASCLLATSMSASNLSSTFSVSCTSSVSRLAA